MKPLYNEQQYQKSKSYDLLAFQCYHCNNTFYKAKKLVTYEIKNERGELKFCGLACGRTYNHHLASNFGAILKVSCKKCGLEFDKSVAQIKKSPNNFCGKSCATSYNNTHKKHGTRRSKFEVWLEKCLTNRYTKLPIEYNKKGIINSELDIYIPSINLAIEVNGIHHYKAIYGQDKFESIIKNDLIKSDACKRVGINLCIIDISKMNAFNTTNSQKYIDKAFSIIDELLVAHVGFEPTCDQTTVSTLYKSEPIMG